MTHGLVNKRPHVHRYILSFSIVLSGAQMRQQIKAAQHGAQNVKQMTTHGTMTAIIT